MELSKNTTILQLINHGYIKSRVRWGLINHGLKDWDTLEVVARDLSPRDFVRQRNVSKTSLKQVKEILERVGLELRRC